MKALTETLPNSQANKPETKGNKMMQNQKVPDVIILSLNWNHLIFLAVMDLEAATLTVASVECVLNYKIYEKVDLKADAEVFLVECRVSNGFPLSD